MFRYSFISLWNNGRSNFPIIPLMTRKSILKWDLKWHVFCLQQMGIKYSNDTWRQASDSQSPFRTKRPSISRVPWDTGHRVFLLLICLRNGNTSERKRFWVYLCSEPNSHKMSDCLEWGRRRYQFKILSLKDFNFCCRITSM